MKKLLLMACVFIITTVHAQLPIPTNKVYDLDKSSRDSVMTSNTAIWQGKRYPVWKTSRNAMFIAAFTKNGKYYRKYIKKE